MVIYLLANVLLFFCQLIDTRAEYAALCFLTRQLLPETLQFAEELAEDALPYGLKIFIMIDDNKFNVSNISTSSNLQLLQIEKKFGMQHNYRDAISTDRPSLVSWDKALFYFGVLHKHYSFIWLCEDDVFIPSAEAFIALHELYSHTSDLVVSDLDVNLLGDTSQWYWKLAGGQLIPPWAKSMVNLIGLSRRLLRSAADYIEWLGRIPFHEYFFHTLAIQLNYTIVIPIELSTDVYRTSYFFQQIQKQPNNIWHPYKDIQTQQLWRESLAKKNLTENMDIQLTNLETLCRPHQKIKTIENQLKDFLVKFEIYKSKYSAKIRRSLRQRFLHLAKQCQQRNASKRIVFLAKTLADHAYKTPERIMSSEIKISNTKKEFFSFLLAQVEILVPRKSEKHLKLEKALEDNRKSISTLPWNSSTLILLRNQAKRLIKRLTVEIQRQYKQRKDISET